MSGALYNEIDPYAAQWLRNLVAAGHIAPGVVDERSIVDLQPADVAGYTQVHFFAGIGGWSLAARLAGWPDDRPLWTGSCPCQPFSVAGAGAGQADARHLWPEFFRLIAARRPDVVMGEQVAAAVGKSWLDGVHSDLESIGYACGAAVVPACAVDAPHRRDRLWFVADAKRSDGHGRSVVAQWGSERRTVDRRPGADALADPDCSRSLPCTPAGIHSGETCAGSRYVEPQRPSDRTLANADGGESFWRSGPLQVGRNAIEGKITAGGDFRGTQWRIKPGLPLLAHGVSGRVGQLRAFGNAIVPQVAAEIIGAYLDVAAAPVLT